MLTIRRLPQGVEPVSSEKMFDASLLHQKLCNVCGFIIMQSSSEISMRKSPYQMKLMRCSHVPLEYPFVCHHNEYLTTEIAIIFLKCGLSS
ncbi:Hypothetical predicted protein [Octopus vulgaris]|uniref:Uncharacterized protein n=1 Tax=Octopus vulgaris TaxID=6645 RepID=A0AA36FKE6_OCTVU|nr:Hypothetical predicted protein [Octopus vulgaris]